MILTLLLLTGVAWADIVKVETGSTIQPPSDVAPLVVEEHSFLMPEPYYDQALIKAKQLPLCQAALDRCAVKSDLWKSTALETLKLVDAQFDQDGDVVTKFTAQIETLERRALKAEGQTIRMRHQRNIAFAVAGGVLVGVAATGAAAIVAGR